MDDTTPLKVGQYGVLCKTHHRYDVAAGRHYLSHERFDNELDAIMFAQEIAPANEAVVVRVTWEVTGG